MRLLYGIRAYYLLNLSLTDVLQIHLRAKLETEEWRPDRYLQLASLDLLMPGPLERSTAINFLHADY